MKPNSPSRIQSRKRKTYFKLVMQRYIFLRPPTVRSVVLGTVNEKEKYNLVGKQHKPSSPTLVLAFPFLEI